MTNALIIDARAELEAAGLSGSFHVADLRTGAEIGIDPDVRFPLDSLIKLPLAACVLEAIHSGRIRGSLPVTLNPDQGTHGPTGTSLFNHAAAIAVEDLVALALTISDDTAADALFSLTPPQAVTLLLRSLGITAITARHTIIELHRTLASTLPPDQRHLALSLAITAGTRGGGHLIPQLDHAASNVGTARAMTRLLQEIWTGDQLDKRTRARLRELMGRNVMRHRLTPEFATDRSQWASKTGTFLHLRHEAGVVEHPDGTLISVTALTASNMPATEQPLAEQTIGAVARRLHDAVRAMQSNR